MPLQKHTKEKDTSFVLAPSTKTHLSHKRTLEDGFLKALSQKTQILADTAQISVDESLGSKTDDSLRHIKGDERSGAFKSSD